MQQITTTTLKTLRAEIDAALATVGQKHGLVLHARNATFNATTATFKLEVATVTDSGLVVTKEAADFKSHAFLVGLKADQLGAEFHYSGRGWTVSGMKPRSKQSILCRRDDGQTFKMTPEFVKLCLAGFGMK